MFYPSPLEHKPNRSRNLVCPFFDISTALNKPDSEQAFNEHTPYKRIKSKFFSSTNYLWLMKHKKLSVFHLDGKESALACSSKKQKRVEILLLACFSFLSFLFLGVRWGALQGLRGCRICRTIPAEPATQWSQSWPGLVPVCTPRASSSNMLLRHLKPSTKWMIAIIKLPFNYSSRCQWCAPLWHYNGLRLPRKCRETQGTITLSKCSLLVTLFPVHQLIF